MMLAGGVTLVGAATGGKLTGVFGSRSASPIRTRDDPAIRDGLRRGLQGALSHFFDRGAVPNHIRPTSGGGPRNGRVDPGVRHPSFWQMACLENVLFHEARLDLCGLGRTMPSYLDANYRHQIARPDLTPMMLAGNDTSGATIYTFDDACLQAMFFMHAHQSLSDAAAGTAALGNMVDTICNACTNFLDPDGTSNPPVAYAAAAPNMANLDYGLGTAAARGPTAAIRYVGRPFRAGRYGSTYTIAAHPNYRQIGKTGASVEAVMALCALYAHRHLELDFMRAYATSIFDLIHDRYLTPDPAGPTRERANVPSDPRLRKAQYLVEADLRLDHAEPNPQDRDAAFLQPLHGFFGKPILAVDSTYLLAATAYCVLGAQLYALTHDDSYRIKAVRTANALVSTQAYGRMVNGKLLLANTRDPHSDGLMMVPFAMEVLPLAGISGELRQAFVDTGRFIARTCVAADGYTSGDWTGPETSVFGTTNWQSLYDANTSGQAGRQQIMVTGNTLAMLQASALIARTTES